MDAREIRPWVRPDGGEELKLLLRIAVLTSLILALVSCATPATNTPPGQTAMPPNQTATPDETAAQETEGADGGEVGERHDVPELEAILPEEIDGIPLTTNSFQGRESIEAGGFDVEDVATSLDRDLDDVSIATATLGDEELEIFVLRIEGASGDEIQQAFHPDVEGYEPFSFGSVVSPASPGEPSTFIWTGDELYVEILTTDRYFADVVISELPRP